MLKFADLSAVFNMIAFYIQVLKSVQLNLSATNMKYFFRIIKLLYIGLLRKEMLRW